MPPHKPPHATWFVNAEVSEAELSEVLDQFITILQELRNKGQVVIQQGADDHQIKPNQSVRSLIRFEKHPRNDYGLKLEIKWFSDENKNEKNTTPITIKK